ncbi:uncharacterized protein V1518DRAFT_413212 [Limtongia smithiae]|uniref:uncharacterized protein n=1 Tax=Limtongia smithiae TaxID=1125753 RepID=UPI0034CF25E4
MKLRAINFACIGVLAVIGSAPARLAENGGMTTTTAMVSTWRFSTGAATFVVLMFAEGTIAAATPAQENEGLPENVNALATTTSTISTSTSSVTSAMVATTSTSTAPATTSAISMEVASSSMETPLAVEPTDAAEAATSAGQLVLGAAPVPPPILPRAVVDPPTNEIPAQQAPPNPEPILTPPLSESSAPPLDKAVVNTIFDANKNPPTQPADDEEQRKRVRTQIIKLQRQKDAADDHERENEAPVKPIHVVPPVVVEGMGYTRRKTPVPVSCMRREIDNGEHVTDEATGQIMYDDFFVCKETGKPLEFAFDVDEMGEHRRSQKNCTITLLDATYHLFQLFVHQDAPLTCHVPARANSESLFAPLVFSVQGTLEQSHLDIATKYTVMFSTTPAGNPRLSPRAKGVNITSAVAFPTYPLNTTRVIIGDDVTFQFTTRWFSAQRVPRQSDRSVASFATIVYCVASFVVAFLVAGFYFLAIVFPQRAQARSSARQAIAAGLAPDFSIFTNGGGRGNKRD